MGTLNLTLPDGRSGTLTIPPEQDAQFAAMSPDERNAFVAHVIGHVGQHLTHSTVTNPPAFASDLGISDLQGGLHDLGTEISQGAKAIGGVMQRNGLPDWGGDLSSAGGWVQQHTPDAPPGLAPSEQLTGAIKRGDWGDVPGLALHAALRALPSAVPIIAAGALTDGAALPALIAGGEAVGPEAYARAANNGRSEPTTGDVVSALPGVAGEALGGALIPGGSKLASPIGRSAMRVAKEALGGAVMDTSGQLGATVGTDKGASLDPAEVAASALSQGAIGAGRSAKEMAGVGIKSGVDQAMARTLTPPASQADAESVLRVVDRMNRARLGASNASGAALPDTAVANTVKQDLASDANRWIAAIQQRGADPSDIADLRNLVNNQALRHNNVTSDDADSLLGRVDSMNLPAADSEVQQFKNAVRDLNTVSSQSFIKNTVGPFQRMGRLAGRVGALGYGVSTGHLPGIVAGIMGDPLAAKVGGVVGAGIDRRLGTNTPPIMLQRINAQRVLRSMGINPADVTDPTLTGPTSAVTGLPPSPVPVSTPIPAGRPLPPTVVPEQTTAPGLQMNTRADVKAAIAEDDGTPAGQPQDTTPSPIDLAQTGALLKAVATAQNGPQAGGTPGATEAPGDASPTPDGAPRAAWSVAAGHPKAIPGGASHAEVLQGLQDAVAAGSFTPAEASQLAQHQGVYPLARLNPIQAAILARRYGASSSPASGDQPGQTWAVDRSEQARTNARGYQQAAAAYAALHPDVGDAVLEIAQRWKTPAEKRTAAAAYVAAHPEALGKFPEWLLDHGRRD